MNACFVQDFFFAILVIYKNYTSWQNDYVTRTNKDQIFTEQELENEEEGNA